MKKIVMLVAAAIILTSCACGSNRESEADSQVDITTVGLAVDDSLNVVADTVAVDTVLVAK